MVKEWDYEAGFFLNRNKYSTLSLCLMAIFGLFQGDPWCLPRQKWLKNATKDISIKEIYDFMARYKPHYIFHMQSRCTCIDVFEASKKAIHVKGVIQDIEF